MKVKPVPATRATVRALVCPECFALPWRKCVGVRGRARTSCHSARWVAYREAYQGAEKATLQ